MNEEKCICREEEIYWHKIEIFHERETHFSPLSSFSLKENDENYLHRRQVENISRAIKERCFAMRTTVKISLKSHFVDDEKFRARSFHSQ